MSQSFYYGGQAVMEGVMMRGRKTMAVACRAPNGEIVIYEEELKPGPILRRVRNMPFVRGAVVLWDTMLLGMRALMFSANVSLQEEIEGDGEQEEIGFPWMTLALLAVIGAAAVWFLGPLLAGVVDNLFSDDLSGTVELGVRGIIAAVFVLAAIVIVRSHRKEVERAANGEQPEPETLTGVLLWMTVGVSLLFSIGLFFVVPVGASAFLERFVDSHFAVNLIEGLIRLGLLIGYLWLISQMEDIRRVFAYHGAEHKTINAYEHNLPLEPSTVGTRPLEHIRCGTGFLLLVVLISVLVFSLLGRPALFWLVTSRIVLVPVIAAIGYEVVRFGANHAEQPIMRAILTPGLILQRLTTREPDEEMLEVAIAAFKRVAARDGALAAAVADDGAINVDDLGRPLVQPAPAALAADG